MVKNILGILAFLFLVPLHAQYIDLKVCNDIKTIEDRNMCLTASLENLINKDMEKNIEMLRLQPGDTIPLKLEIEVSAVGNFSITSIQTPSFAVARAVDAAITALKPIDIYRDEAGEIVRAQLNIETVYTTKSNGSLESLSKNNPKSTPENTEKDINNNDGVAFAEIENVPVFPGCSKGKTNKERKDCMSRAIQTHVATNFDVSIANSLEITGLQRIFVNFRINKNGFVTNVTARAPHPLLEEEAVRVISSLPKMTPGKQKGENVSVLYSLPIRFQIDDDSKQQAKKKRRG